MRIFIFYLLFCSLILSCSNSEKDFTEFINPDSLTINTSAYLEKSLENADPETNYQFERLGYFKIDSVDSEKDNLVFNRTVTLRDSWAKKNKGK